MKKRNGLVSLFGVSLVATVLLAGCSGLANPPKKARVTFDASRITCTLSQGAREGISSGTMIAENTALYFTADIPQGKAVKEWTVNGKARSSVESFLYYVNLKELKLKDGAEITVGVSDQDAQPVIVTFDKEKVLAYKLVNDPREYPHEKGTSIDSGTTYAAGSWLRFEAKPLKGKMVDYWTVNGKQGRGMSANGTYVYEVRLADAVKTKDTATVAVSFTEKEAMVALTFDAAKVTCSYYDEHGNSVSVLSGKKLPLGTKVTFNAKNIETGKTIENWYVSEHKQEVKESASASFTYVIDARDIKDRGIAIRYELTNEKKVTVKFDEAKIYSVDATDKQWAEDKVFTFYARLAENESVKTWMVNGINGRDITEDASSDKSYVSYTVLLSDAKDGVIEISYTTTTTKVKVEFEKNDIFCTQASGKEWSEGTRFEFKAKVPAGEVFEGWYINGKRQNNNSKTFYYPINMEDAKDGVITVTRKLYDKVKITFDKDKVQVQNRALQELESGALCAEGEDLVLTAKIDVSQVVDKWLINGFKASDLWGNSTQYRVHNRNAKTEGDAKVISIGLEAKARPAAPDTKVTVTFDKTTMSCTRDDAATSAQIAVEPGTELDMATLGYNERKLTFTATLQAGEAVAAWRVNGVVKSSGWGVSNTYLYTIDKDDFEGGVRSITITYDKK